MPASLARITRNSLHMYHFGTDSQVTSGFIVSKKNINLDFRIDNNTILLSGFSYLAVNFTKNGEKQAFFKYTNKEYEDNGDANPAFIAIENLDHNQDPMSVVEILSEYINSDDRL